MPFPLALSQFDSFSLCFFFSLLSFCTVVLCPLVLNLSKWRLTPSQWGRAGAIFFYAGIKIFRQIVGIFHQRRGVAVFHQISEDFHPSALSEYFLNVYDVKKHTVSRKNKT